MDPLVEFWPAKFPEDPPALFPVPIPEYPVLLFVGIAKSPDCEMFEEELLCLTVWKKGSAKEKEERWEVELRSRFVVVEGSFTKFVRELEDPEFVRSLSFARMDLFLPVF